MSHFFAYISRMRLIRRWGLMRNTGPENIQEHSLQVAVVAHGLAVIKKEIFGKESDPERIITLAVFHEAAEVITGDLAAPIKYFNPEIKKAYGEIEEAAQQRLHAMLPRQMRETYRTLLFHDERDTENWEIVKAADKICAYLKCVEELKAGNLEFSKAERAIKNEIETKYGTPEVKYFTENFVPSFSLTLDELN